MKRLTFTNGKFYLHDGELSRMLPLKGAAGFQEYADEKAATALNRAYVKIIPLPTAPLPLHLLDPHQVDGITWILSRSRSYLAHAPGAGKTRQAIIASLWAQSRAGHTQTLFIVPPSLTANWARETWNVVNAGIPGVKRWPSISIIPTSNRQDFAGWGSEFVICPDSMLTRPWVLDRLIAMPKKFVAIDEASRFKDPHAQRTRALFGGLLKNRGYVPGLVYDAIHTVLLDGSPMPNRPHELWAPLFAMCPEAIDFMDEITFGLRYCGARRNSWGAWEFKGSTHEKELNRAITHQFMHVVGEEKLSHPERKRSLLYMGKDIRSSQQKVWEKKNLGALVTHIKGEEASQGDVARFRRELGIKKIPFIAEYVGGRLKGKNESILLFAWHREVVLGLAEKLREFNPGVVMGGVGEAEREKLFDHFQNGRIKLLIMNIAAGGRGHNLQKADRIIFGEYSWCDETNKQCEKRSSRRGNEKAFVRCEYVVAPHSMDETVLQAVFRKAESVKKVIANFPNYGK